MTYFPIKKTSCFSTVINDSFSYYLMSAMTFNTLVFKKTPFNFWTLPLFYLISLSLEHSISKNKRIKIVCGLLTNLHNGFMFN